MPFKSKSQMRMMFAKDPAMAKEWADKTPNMSKLPEHVAHAEKHAKAAQKIIDLHHKK